MAIDFSKKTTATFLLTSTANPSVILDGQSRNVHIYNYDDFSWTASGDFSNSLKSSPIPFNGNYIYIAPQGKEYAIDSTKQGDYKLSIYSGGEKIFESRERFIGFLPVTWDNSLYQLNMNCSVFSGNFFMRWTEQNGQQEPASGGVSPENMKTVRYVHVGDRNNAYFAIALVKRNDSVYIALASRPDKNGDMYLYISSNSGIMNNWKLTSAPQEEPSYLDQNIAESGGATGDFDNTSDEVDFPDDALTNTIDVINAVGALQNIYHITASALSSLSSFLWSDSFIDNIKKYFASPSEALSGLFILPFSVTDKVAKNVVMGNIDTGIGGHTVSQFTWIDCGEYNLSEYWGNFADYSHTTLKLYLPYVGIVPIPTTYYMARTIKVRYKVDCYTGAFICFVRADNNLLGQYNGTMAYNMPTSSASYNQLASLLTTIGGATATVAGLATGNMLATAGGLATMFGGGFGSSKANINNGGNFSGNIGVMGNRKPYLIIERAVQQTGADYQSLVGFPSYITATLGNLKGFTKVSEIHLEHVRCTDAEKIELERLLKEGVIL